MMELREESPSSAASRRLWAEYQALVRGRLGESFVATEEIFATDDAFAAPGGAWLVGYEDGVAVACGGLRRLDAETVELKRMFVSSAARGRGHGRRLLAELERRAAEGGARRIRLLTTEVLREARALYASVGYRVAETAVVDGRRDYWLEREVTGGSPGSDRSR